MEKSKPVSLYNVYLYCDKCGGLMKEVNSSVGAVTHSLGYDYRCEQCGKLNETSYAGAPRTTCATCGAKRPGNPGDWYKI